MLVELVEWWEDIAESGVDSQAVIVPVPHRWGRTTVLSDFAGAVAGGTTLGGLVRIDGLQAPDGRGLQALWLGAQLLEQAQVRPGVLELTWNMNDDDAKAITTFLMSQKGKL